MNDINQTIYVNNLLTIYGSLLTKKQRSMLESYYTFNLSLSEISENEGISRSAVLDNIKKGIKNMENYENNLHLLAKNKKITEIIDGNYSKEEIIKMLKELM